MRRAWARASGLARSPDERIAPAVAVSAAAGIQAQDRRAARLSVWARARHLDAAAVEHALVAERSLVRTWAMRGTLHLMAAQDVRWVLALLGPAFVAATGRRFRELGLDEEACTIAVGVIGKAVATEGPLTRAVLGDRVRAGGVDVDPGSQAVAHLVRRAALEGVVCCGPDDEGSETYVGLDDWIGGRGRHGPRGEAALAELARRHLRAFGPARPEDFASWSGLPMAQARAAWRLLDGELTEVVAAGRPAWVLAGTLSGAADRDRPQARLLPAFDTYLLGHKGRDLIVENRFSRKVWPGGGWIHPTVVVDGRVVATWRLGRDREVEVEPFAPIEDDVAAGVEAETARLRAFLGAS
ncbi:MAG TPA: winged helix DNA-binding domain-containing protein [Acidimicrobiales bacterium]|nr:winged helix DNA-binding domain-containing protein [Acidimicrobiales bacterium]